MNTEIKINSNISKAFAPYLKTLHSESGKETIRMTVAKRAPLGERLSSFNIPVDKKIHVNKGFKISTHKGYVNIVRGMSRELGAIEHVTGITTVTFLEFYIRVPSTDDRARKHILFNFCSTTKDLKACVREAKIFLESLHHTKKANIYHANKLNSK